MLGTPNPAHVLTDTDTTVIPRPEGATAYTWDRGYVVQTDKFGKVYVVSIRVNERYATPHGLHTYSRARTHPDGSSRADVIKAMGNPSRIVVRSTDNANLLVYDSEGILFWIRTRTGDFQDQVFQITVFEPVR